MKRLISLILVLVLSLSSCSFVNELVDEHIHGNFFGESGSLDTEHPETPVDPEPEQPDEPETPADPEPEQPDEPETPVDPEPEQPDEPETPVDPEPEQPDEPETPVDPEPEQPDEPETPDEHSHNYIATVTAPTCENTGYTIYICSSCDDFYISDRTAALGHSYKSVVTAATCESAGYTTYTCSVCGYSYVSGSVAALGHSWKDATTETPKTCQTCGATEGEKLPSAPESGVGYGETLYISYNEIRKFFYV